MKEKLKQIDKKKIGIVGIFLILIIIVLFGGAFLYNRFFYKRSYSEIESIMIQAAKNHFSKNSDELPKNYNDFVSVSIDNLVTVEEMKPISEYLKDETVQCNGNVIITNINGKYRYTPSLDCGNAYKTVKFIEHIKNNVPIVEEGNGLYNLNNELVYRGDNVDNYLKLGENLYQIVKFTPEENPVIIYSEKSENITWDDRYNIEKNSKLGINDYSVSRIKDYLEEGYEKEIFIREEDKMLVVAHNLHMGKRNEKDTDKSGNLEQSVMLENQFISILPLYDYLNASLDANCTVSISKSCTNYNYLAKHKYKWWSMTATNLNSYKVYRIDGYASLTSANATGSVRPVFHLTKETLYVSGDGSIENPYIIK